MANYAKYHEKSDSNRPIYDISALGSQVGGGVSPYRLRRVIKPTVNATPETLSLTRRRLENLDSDNEDEPHTLLPQPAFALDRVEFVEGPYLQGDLLGLDLATAHSLCLGGDMDYSPSPPSQDPLVLHEGTSEGGNDSERASDNEDAAGWGETNEGGEHPHDGTNEGGEHPLDGGEGGGSVDDNDAGECGPAGDSSDEEDGDTTDSGDNDNDSQSELASPKGRPKASVQALLDATFADIDRLFAAAAAKTLRPVSSVVGRYQQRHGRKTAASGWNCYQAYFARNTEKERLRVGNPVAIGM